MCYRMHAAVQMLPQRMPPRAAVITFESVHDPALPNLREYALNRQAAPPGQLTNGSPIAVTKPVFAIQWPRAQSPSTCKFFRQISGVPISIRGRILANCCSFTVEQSTRLMSSADWRRSVRTLERVAAGRAPAPGKCVVQRP
jgi:hypothetical protein